MDSNRAVLLDPNDANSYVARAFALMRQRKFDKSLEDCGQAIRLDPKNARAYSARGIALSLRGEVEPSIEALTEAIRLDPGDISNYLRRAWQLSKGRPDDAIADYTQIIQLDPENAQAFDRRGDLLEKSGQFGKALDDYHASLRLEPKSAAVCNNIARIHAACPDERYRDGKQAVDFAIKACELRGKEFWGDLGWLAAAYAETGDFASAIKWGEKSLELAPDYAKRDFTERLEFYRAGKPCRDLYLKYHRLK